MEKISLYLEKFKNLLPYEVAVKKLIQEIVLEKFKQKIDTKDINLSGRTAYLKLRPALKNAIFIHQEEILEELEAKLTQLAQSRGPSQLV
jgi:hypothetical protein